MNVTPEEHEDINQPGALPALWLSDPAFFFNIDGTLAEICVRPEEAPVPLARLTLLRVLFRGCDGAVGIISRRRLADIGDLLAPLETPFQGRLPVFVEDDLTDEQGFEAAQALGGIAIESGTDPTCAAYRPADVDAVGEWLSGLATLADPPCADKAVSR
ncbi:hypothetical protein [Lonsdalea populi]|uniref:hypothetical protein n=1 Tax=Lonsdalea populi TaxID=1172565 RepID=UPI002181F190|nr:hypothetical protein [Lonsdalea populi]